MAETRESITLTYPHDVYRRFKEDEYLSLDEKVAKINETCEQRFALASKGYVGFRLSVGNIRFFFVTLSSFRRFEGKEDEGNIVEKQLLEHNLELQKLHRTGDALMTNVRTACERRQLKQREREKSFEEGN